MKVTLESTTQIVDLETPTGTVPARIWEGTTESGVRVHALITRIAIDRDEPRADEFERELKEQRAPSAKVGASYPARIVL